MSAPLIRKRAIADVQRFDHRSLMWIYEQNYGRVLKLINHLGLESGRHCPPQGELDLRWERISADKYTETWRFTYEFESGDEPDVWVRIYHDSTQAEAWKVGQHSHVDFLEVFETEVGSLFEKRWARNMLLHKWLEYLLNQF